MLSDYTEGPNVIIQQTHSHLEANQPALKSTMQLLKLARQKASPYVVSKSLEEVNRIVAKLCIRPCNVGYILGVETWQLAEAVSCTLLEEGGGGEVIDGGKSPERIFNGLKAESNPLAHIITERYIYISQTISFDLLPWDTAKNVIAKGAHPQEAHNQLTKTACLRGWSQHLKARQGMILSNWPLLHSPTWGLNWLIVDEILATAASSKARLGM